MRNNFNRNNLIHRRRNTSKPTRFGHRTSKQQRRRCLISRSSVLVRSTVCQAVHLTDLSSDDAYANDFDEPEKRRQTPKSSIASSSSAKEPTLLEKLPVKVRASVDGDEHCSAFLSHDELERRLVAKSR